MRTLPLAVLALLSGVVGCTPSGLLRMGRSYEKMRLYPAPAGPDTAASPAPLLATITGLSSGTITVTLPSGERCEGPWQWVPRDEARPVVRGGEAVDRSSLEKTWRAQFSADFYNVTVLSQSRSGCAVLRGSQGTRIQLEFVRRPPTEGGHGFVGVALDSGGTAYHLTL